MDLTKLLEALAIGYLTTGKAKVPSFWTIGTTKVEMDLNITTGADGRMEFELSLPATTVKL
jgi:hypothetical protein